MRKTVSRDDILTAAMTVAERDGASRLTIEAVAREVGLSKAGLLYTYPSKNALLSALLARMIERISTPEDAEQPDAAGDAPDMSSDLVTFRRFLREEPHLPNAILTAGTQNPELLNPLRDFLGIKANRACNQTSDPVMALVLLAAMDGMMLQHILKLPPSEPEIREKMLDRIAALIAQLEVRS